MIPAQYLSRSAAQGIAGETASTARVALVAPAGAVPDAGTMLAGIGYAVHPLTDTDEVAVLCPDLVVLHSDLVTVPVISGLLPMTTVVIYGGNPEVADVVAWMRAGAADYLEAIVGRWEWHRRLHRALAGHRRDT